jgi:hypothetical protein
MPINPVSNSSINIVNAVSNRKDTGADTEALPDAPAAVFVGSQQTDQTKTLTYSSAQVSVLNPEDQKYASLGDLIGSLLTSQTLQANQAAGKTFSQIIEKYSGNLKNFIQGLQVDDTTRAAAQQAVSDDGYWGVKQTAARAVDFAISLSGGDTAKLKTLKGAIEEGYSQAEKAWGGSLPDICMQTKDAIMKGLDEWASQNA